VPPLLEINNDDGGEIDGMNDDDSRMDPQICSSTSSTAAGWHRRVVMVWCTLSLCLCTWKDMAGKRRYGGKQKDMAGNQKIRRETKRYGGKPKDMARNKVFSIGLEKLIAPLNATHDECRREDNKRQIRNSNN